MGVAIVSPPTGLCRMLVWLGRRTVQNMVIGSGQYTLLSGRPVQTGQVLFEFKFTTSQSELLQHNLIYLLYFHISQNSQFIWTKLNTSVEVIRSSNTRFVAATVLPGFLAFA